MNLLTTNILYNPFPYLINVLKLNVKLEKINVKLDIFVLAFCAETNK